MPSSLGSPSSMHSAMEQTRYWTWERSLTGRPHLISSRTPAAAGSSTYESWEEQAFAEDSSGQLGGCIWPPRSYTCSFCRREFRSAQALGGHMNVHRRDRARLKQPSSPTSESQDDRRDHHVDPFTPLGAPCPPSQLSTQLLCNPHNPNPNLASGRVSSSVASAQENISKHIIFSPSYSPSNNQENQKESLLYSTLSLKDPWPEFKLGREKRRLGLMGSRIQREEEDEDEKGIGGKRRRTHDSVLPFFVKSSAIEQKFISEEVIKLSPCPVEELDLELRLGGRPKVK